MRRTARMAAMLSLLTILAAAPMAQGQDQPDVIGRIPANALGFVVVRDLEQSFGSFDQFIVDIGMGGALPGRLLELAKQQTAVGDGLDESGSLAVVFLDPAQFGMTLDEAFGGDEPPIALLVPGDDPESVFINYQPTETKNGLYELVMPTGEPAFAGAVGGHSILADTPKIINAVADATATIDGELSDQHLQLLSGTDVGVYVNMAMVAPTLGPAMEQFIDNFSQMGPQGAAGAQPMVPMLDLYRDMFDQMHGLSLGITVGQAGALIDAYAGFTPDSEWGQMLSDIRMSRSVGFDRLPNLQYVLAYAADMTGFQPFMQRYQQASMESLEQNPDLQMDDQARQQIMQAVQAMQGQGNRGQVYLGGADGQGLFAMATVAEAENPGQVAENVGQIFERLSDSIRQSADADMPEFSMSYQPRQTTVAGAPVDAILFDFEEMEPEARSAIETAFGESDLSMRMASLDDSLVTTFGGGDDFLAQSIGSARGQGKTLASNSEINQVLEQLPQNRFFTLALSLKNMLELAQRAGATLGEEETANETWMHMQIRTDRPIVMGAAADGPGVHKAIFVPTELIRELIPFVQIQMQQVGAGAPPAGAY